MIFNLIKRAKELFFDNSKSGLKATDVQGAIDEVNNKLINVNSNLGTYKDIRLTSIKTNQYGYTDDISSLIKEQISDLKEIINTSILNWDSTYPPHLMTADGKYLAGASNTTYSVLHIRVFYR